MINIDDKTIISLLERAIDDNNLDQNAINICNMCIESLKGENIKDKEMARKMAKPFISKYLSLASNNSIKSHEADNISIRERAIKYAKEIRVFLDTKDLVANIACELEIILEKITNPENSQDEIHKYCILYEQIYKKAALESNNLILDNKKNQKQN